jgi:hypothetical protein
MYVDPSNASPMLDSTGNRMQVDVSTKTLIRATARPRKAAHASAHVASTWFRPAKRAKTLVVRTTDQRFKTESNGVRVRLRASRLCLAQELLVDL